MNKKNIKIVSLVVGSAICFSCLATAVCISAEGSLNKTENKLQTNSVPVENALDLSSNSSNVAFPLSETILTEISSENTEFETIESEFESVKEEIWHKMLNSIDYYNTVSGKMVYADCPDGEVYVEYQTNLDESNAYTKVQEVNVSDSSAIMSSDFSSFSDANTFAVEVFTDGTSLTMLDNLNRTAVNETNSVFTRENSEPLDDDERVVIEEDGTPGYYYRCDITNTFLASVSLLPQEMAFGFLTDFNLWDVDKVDTYAQRECYVISGVSSDDYGKKVGVQNFQMYVDCETGVLLNYIGYDENENIHAYLATEEIHFEEDNAIIYKPSTSGYAFIE